ncbi:MAG: isoamylase [Gammaproteobacteria bacterium]|nr:isoamylase [Gammaproteobacteria bacterium]
MTFLLALSAHNDMGSGSNHVSSLAAPASEISPVFAERFTSGSVTPLGATIDDLGTNFSLFAHCDGVTLVLSEPERRFEFGQANRTGDVWHGHVPGVGAGTLYHFEVRKGERCYRAIDPYAKAVDGFGAWDCSRSDPNVRSVIVSPARRQWTRPHRAWADTIIYEAHVRGFTQDPSSGVAHPGTYLGLTEKIPYLQSLGVTAIELLPVFEFNEAANPRFDLDSGRRLADYWGYNPVAYFAPKAAYASANTPQGAIDEFQHMVEALHDAGIEVLLDVVFNHTGENDPTRDGYSFKLLADDVYYHVDDEGGYADFTGCGNSLNCNHPIVADFVVDVLRYWVSEMGVDGFRFDLASTLTRGKDGRVLQDPPVLERIASDPVLSETKLISESWDAVGLYQVGEFAQSGRWVEWNDRFRDDVRKFVRSEADTVGSLIERFEGSADIFSGSPHHSLNFVTCHDGFTLWDLVSFDNKRNEANGESGQDGSNNNLSWNCGAEGPSSDPKVLNLRVRQVKNFLALTLLAKGTPMLLAGDERCNSQSGNNNPYCQDSPVSWLDWHLSEGRVDLCGFVSYLSALRNHPVFSSFRQGRLKTRWTSLGGDDRNWWECAHGAALTLSDESGDALILINNHWEPCEHAFRMPRTSLCRVLDTAVSSPEGMTRAQVSTANPYCVSARSIAVFVESEGYNQCEY